MWDGRGPGYRRLANRSTRAQTYYFCSPGCKRAFDKEPQKYVAKQHGSQGPHGGHA